MSKVFTKIPSIKWYMYPMLWFVKSDYCSDTENGIETLIEVKYFRGVSYIMNQISIVKD